MYYSEIPAVEGESPFNFFDMDGMIGTVCPDGLIFTLFVST